ncbi:hypothetical protein OAA21_00565 [bacterium]|jgi:hypothetical protein|nr:hypothetical protein [bacterium]|tara:strand:+ start:769 stop:1071 length:303 start_codon:yes stop_codon:yes gene_type:complete
MKTLKAKTLHPKKQILKISDLAYNKHYTKYDVKLNQGVDNITDIMEQPIEVFKHQVSNTPRVGALGKAYKEKQFSVHKGGQRVTRAVKLGYTHIEAIVYE